LLHAGHSRPSGVAYGMPGENRYRCSHHHLCFLITVTSAALTHFELPEWVGVVTAFATAATSWVDFVGYVSKLDSYTSTISALESHLSWWHSLDETEKAGTLANDRLVMDGERFILATRFSRSLMLQEKKVADAGVEGAASGKAVTDKAAIEDGKAAIEADNYPEASTNPQAKMLALQFNRKAQGLYTDAKEAREVHLISTPFDHVAGAALACEVKARINNPDTFVVCINPNTDIGEIASDRGWSKEVQEKKWLEVFMGLLRIAQNRKERGSKVHIICRNNKPCDPDAGDTPELVGNAQRGELLAALIAGFNEDDGSMVYEIFRETP